MKSIFLTLILSWTVVIVSCGPGNHASNKEQDSADVKLPVQAPPADSLREISAKKVEIKPNSVINVKSMDLVLDESMPDDSMVQECKKWSLPTGAIETIFKNGKPIDMHEFSYLYYVLPCKIKGMVEIDSALYKYSVNAGSHFIISNADTSYFYGCNTPACKKFFLMQGGDPKRDLK